ncbi:NF038122 family metalloprotease [Geitlerinema sp. PCC 7407]|uniref:NF038122 family metalloprotease n=1 Tax=Geitlerinema sp. PCC 7407 TaxID=1173025 RepID=UPI00029FB454|nr:NF038122 family metalloprotease [Geitlerinema sp. PCC 7407]AFY65602.1 protein of unknown function DUF1555 [Geitlerinema sp. PCC 7407]
MKLHTLFPKQSRRSLIPLALAAAANLAGPIPRAQALTFNFSAAAGTPESAIAGFRAAGDLWSSVVTDDVVVNLEVSFLSLESDILGRAQSTEQLYRYSAVRSALLQDVSSQDDAIATSFLPGGDSVDLWINYTENSPSGVGSPTPYRDSDGDANNANLRLTSANAKALGLPTSSLSDGLIRFNRDFQWDFDRSDGIAAGTFDFIGAAAHEIGHILGFNSGVDVLDTNSPLEMQGDRYFFRDDQMAFVSPLDLFRYSDASRSVGIPDWTAGESRKYFSIDGGTTAIVDFATGAIHGDGQSASHWKQGQTLGMMDPDLRQGEILPISEEDLRAFDVIGWNLPKISPGPGFFPEDVDLAIPLSGWDSELMVAAAWGDGAPLRRAKAVPEPGALLALVTVSGASLGWLRKKRSGKFSQRR